MYEISKYYRHIYTRFFFVISKMLQNSATLMRLIILIIFSGAFYTRHGVVHCSINITANCRLCIVYTIILKSVFGCICHGMEKYQTSTGLLNSETLRRSNSLTLTLTPTPTLILTHTYFIFNLNRLKLESTG